MIGLGIFLAAAFVVPLVAGLVLDAAIHTSPLFLFIGVIVGLAAATFGVYRRIKRYL